MNPYDSPDRATTDPAGATRRLARGALGKAAMLLAFAMVHAAGTAR
jgi:hypothetical protein